MQAILKQVSTNFTQYYPEIDINEDNPMYLVVTLNIDNLNDGEYQFELYTDNNELVAGELIRIGDFNTKTQQYKIEKKYTQYVRK